MKDRQGSTSGAASGGSASPTVTGPTAVSGPSVEEFPVAFDEWAGTVATPWRLLIAGFRFHLRHAGALERTQFASEWQAEFDAWRVLPA